MKPYLSSEAFAKEEGFASLSAAALAKVEWHNVPLHTPSGVLHSPFQTRPAIALATAAEALLRIRSAI